MKNLKAKLLFLGCTNVGKSSIITRYAKGTYTPGISSTISAAFTKVELAIEDYQITLDVWDTAGQERFRCIVPMYYRNVDVVVIVFDLSSRDSFDQVRRWIDEVKQSSDTPVIFYVVGNKTDLIMSRDITYDEAKEYATSIYAHYCETSASLDTGIQELFSNIGHSLIEIVENSDRPNNIRLEIEPEEVAENVSNNDSKKFCCAN